MELRYCPPLVAHPLQPQFILIFQLRILLFKRMLKPMDALCTGATTSQIGVYMDAIDLGNHRQRPQTPTFMNQSAEQVRAGRSVVVQ